MKPSRYNRLVALESGDTLLFNAFSGALAKLGPGGMAGVPDQDLAEGGFIVDERVDELEVYRHRWYAAQHDPTSFAIMVCPTMRCDMNCRYCFEDRDDSVMDQATAGAVAQLVASKLDTARSVNVVWFGGEPLLELDILENLSHDLAARVSAAGAVYRAAMFTNGYGLGSSEATRLKGAGVEELIIPLDGPRDVHEARRPHAGGHPVFDRILANAAEASQHCHVTFQCTIDEENEAAAWELYDFLAEHGYLRRAVFKASRVNCDLYLQTRLGGGVLAIHDYDRGLIKAYRTRRGRPGLEPPYPAFCLGCTYQRHSCLVVDAGGYLYKCAKTVGRREWSVGTVNDPPDLDSPALASWLKIDPLRRPQCRECGILPLCGGGCAMSYLERGTPLCSHLKATLDEWLVLHAEWQEAYDTVDAAAGATASSQASRADGGSEGP